CLTSEGRAAREGGPSAFRARLLTITLNALYMRLPARPDEAGGRRASQKNLRNEPNFRRFSGLFDRKTKPKRSQSPLKTKRILPGSAELLGIDVEPDDDVLERRRRRGIELHHEGIVA